MQLKFTGRGSTKGVIAFEIAGGAFPSAAKVELTNIIEKIIIKLFIRPPKKRP